jgi:Sec-independent protein translocase protein TatA
MIGLSFSEIIVILLVILVIVNPKDIPIIIKYFKKVRSYFQNFNKEFSSIMNNISSELDGIKLDNEEEIKQINFFLKEICDNGGKYEGEYNLEKIKAEYDKILLSKKS